MDEQQFVNSVVLATAMGIREKLAVTIMDGPFTPTLSPAYTALELPLGISIEDAIRDYVRPAAMSLARFINDLGKFVHLKAPEAPTAPGTVTYVVSDSDIPVRGVLTFDGIKQKYLLVLTLYAEASNV
jgi:hypothetical protein